AIQIQLTQIWESLLGIEDISLNDDFFALGGHSLLAAKMVDRIERECGVKIPLTTLFAAPTIQSLAESILKAGPGDTESEIIRIQNGRGRIPFFFLHGDLQGGGFYCKNLAAEIGVEQSFYAMR